MSNLIFKDTSIRTNNNLVCLTDMAKPYGKLVGHWLENQTTKSFLSALSADIVIPITILIETSDVGTFAHPEVAIAFAQWLSPEIPTLAK
jgi:KilA-N domain